MNHAFQPKNLFRTGLKVAFTLAATFCLGAPAQAQERVRIGYNGDFHGASLIAIANKLELWKKHGLIAEAKVFTNGPVQIQALGTGDLDFGYIGPGALWLPMSGRAKVVAMNVVGTSDRVIAQPGIKSIQDLKGKTIAIPEGTSGDMLVRIALQKAGMKMEDIKRVTMDPSTLVAAFASGQVDAAGIWYPHIATIKRRVPELVELFGNQDAMPTYSFPSAFVMRNELDTPDKAPLARSFLLVLKEANDWRKNNVAQTIDLVAALLKAPRGNLEEEAKFAHYYSSAELSELSANGTVKLWLTGMNDLFKTFGRISENVDPAKYYLGDAYIAAKP